MKRHHMGLWLLLLSAFALFGAVSAYEMPEICGHRLHSAGIADTLLDVHPPVGLMEEEGHDSDMEPASAVSAFPAPMDSASKTILFIGDSMLEGLGPRLAAYASANGHTLYNVIWYSSTTEVWGRSDKLEGYISRIRPDYIFICLGANELFVNDIAAKRRGYIQKMVADIDTIPYVWIGPPNWREDTGINALIASEVPEGSFFLSDGMEFDRSADGAHPTRASAALWMDSVARWMPAHSRHPIRMQTPEAQSGRPARVFVHQPNEQ